MRYSSSQYAQALYEALEGKTGTAYSDAIKNFLTIIQKNRGTSKLPAIISHYEKIYLARQGLTKIEVTSASSLSNEIKEELEMIFHKKIVLSEKVDTRLIAGCTFLMNNTVFIDASAKTRINNLFSCQS